jgi:hypothetical protein
MCGRFTYAVEIIIIGAFMFPDKVSFQSVTENTSGIK